MNETPDVEGSACVHSNDDGVRGAAVVVIGGGVTGLSAAWWLARDGVDTLVVDIGPIGWAASGRNGGGCSHHHSPLFREEQRLWPLMDELLAYPTEFQPNRVRIALNESQMTLFQRAFDNAAHQGFRTDILDAKQVRELVPFAGENALGGYFHHFGGHANPHRTVQAYAWALQDLGGRIMQHTGVVGFNRQGGRVVSIVTDRGLLFCDHVVIAAGPATGMLAAHLGTNVPLVSARAEMLVTEPLPLMPIGGVDGNGLYGRQTLRGNLAYGGGPHEWVLQPDASSVRPHSTVLQASIARRLCELLPRAAQARVIRSWAGFIENTPDGRPILDRPANLENVVIATMSSVGFGLSPAAGRAIRDLVMTGSCTFADLSTLQLSRFVALEADWQARQGWLPLHTDLGPSASS
jgi:sarcosine oxidase subunit beta